MSGDKRYVYGIVEADPLDIDAEGVAGATAFDAVEHRTIAAVVSDVDTLDPERSEANVEAHDEVLRAVMNDGGRAVVPMQFGMVFENDAALTNVLRSGHRAFTSALADVADAEELGVKVVAPQGDGADAAEIRETVEAELDPLSVAVSEGDRFSDRLVLNRSYLVRRSDRDEFDEAIDRVQAAHDDVAIQYTGPFAPYSFVDIEIGVEQ